MIIKRNDFTTYLETQITKEQNQVLQSVPGFRVKYVNLLSMLTECLQRSYHYDNTRGAWTSTVHTPDCFIEEFNKTLKDYHYKPDFMLVHHYHRLPNELVLKYCNIINNLFFDFIRKNENADFFNTEYMAKMIDNILKMAKFQIDDF